MGKTSETHPNLFPLEEKFVSFGWHASTVDGHDVESLIKNLEINSDKPKIIIAKTIKGKGVTYMQENPIWHYRSPDKDELLIAVREIKGSIDEE